MKLELKEVNNDLLESTKQKSNGILYGVGGLSIGVVISVLVFN